jgi:hypothetical protein
MCNYIFCYNGIDLGIIAEAILKTTMKYLTNYIWGLSILAISCGQVRDKTIKTPQADTSTVKAIPVRLDSNSTSNFSTDTSTTQNKHYLTHDFKDYKEYKLSEVIIADFNGDKKPDSATFLTRNGKAGIIIKDGLTSKETIIGCGNNFEEMGDDFGWVEFWGLVYDKSTYNIMVKDSELVGSKNVALAYPSIFLRKEEVGGGVITFKNGKYIWLHQAD